ncbi:MAG: DUF1501 domain-containing protein [Burkholderiales bacterium]|nr:DUF1501 domain-containing protein [Burkholderiales bacterium]MDE2276047.1 DUF1501 domain-containing protein [Burkholderiales bacterium]
MPSRRRVLARFAAAAALSPLSPLARLSVAAPGRRSGDSRFVFMILRGGMDGLTAVPAPGDPAFAEARGALGRFDDFGRAPLRLDDTFALHPLLTQLHTMYGQGELAVLHATGQAWRQRSHFDGQQVLESGGTQPYQLSDGWLGRALAGAGAGPLRGVALDTAVPLVLRGPREVDTWAPSFMPDPSDDLVARLQALYRDDPALSRALARARGLHEIPGLAANEAADRHAQAMTVLAAKAAEFLQRESQVAVLDMTGWDSHVNQAAPNGPTSSSLRALDAALGALRAGLQPGGTWSRTVVIVATEFGRTVAINGTQGTDHGSGGVALALGGAVRGGRVVADWPGLAPAQRYQGRDLRTTTDLRSALRTVLADHLQIAPSVIDADVLPGSAGLPRLDLLRT